MAINYAAFSSLTNSTNSSITSDYGPSLNTQIAMIVLYTVTGLVSALFLLVIALGAIRAHRHPERYGPRAARRGRAPQTRAGGLARAMLDSLPIQKFGSPDTPKEPDVELATAEGAPNTADSHHSPTLTKDSPATTFESSPDQSPELDRASIRSGIGPATVVTEQARPQATEAPSCSICTDDFEAGQDMRVLPCNHKFHPACVDPWLMNVSGTCPMCRIDLNPNPEPGAERTSTESHGSAHSDRGGRWNPDLAEAPNRGRGTTLPRNRAARVNPFNPNAAPIPSLGESAAAWTQTHTSAPAEGSPTASTEAANPAPVETHSAAPEPTGTTSAPSPTT
ncbi:hypothetical protein ANO11243_085820 [Dothideomycetidae sp. 11243]|nr:hypothetical protein ANO11243_085820 [fungal sp. No.11243]